MHHLDDLMTLIPPRTTEPKKIANISGGTLGRVYGGDPNLIHIADGKRIDFGDDVAGYIDERMRRGALTRGDRTIDEALFQKLCPGCYMVAGFNALVHLANHNGQSLKELADTMCAAFQALAEAPDSSDATIESINVVIQKREAKA